MKIKYSELIDQTLYFPTEEFNVEEHNLKFHDIPLMDLVERFGTPLKFNYLPKISINIQRLKIGLERPLRRIIIRKNIIIAIVQNQATSNLYWMRH